MYGLLFDGWLDGGVCKTKSGRFDLLGRWLPITKDGMDTLSLCAVKEKIDKDQNGVLKTPDIWLWYDVSLPLTS
jgi:hypothetical protein